MSGKSSLTLSEKGSLFLEPFFKEFPAAGLVDLSHALESSTFKTHLSAFDQWISDGHQGTMSYLEKGRDRRSDPKLLFSETKSVLCVLEPYSKISKTNPSYARYLNAGDYHSNLKQKLQKVLEQQVDSNYPRLKYKINVDTSAVLERAWAQLCGLGWIGKNSLLIHPKLGSYVFIGVVFLNLEFGSLPDLVTDLCGNCERCLKACPTQAIESMKKVIATQCISYWTLEKRGDLALSSGDYRKIGPWIAGCDICQEVCPFNFKPVLHELRANAPADKLSVDLNSNPSMFVELFAESKEEYQTRVRHSALSRVKPEQFRRNLAIVFRNHLSNYCEVSPPPLNILDLKKIDKNLDVEIKWTQDSSLRAILIDCQTECRKWLKPHHLELEN